MKRAAYFCLDLLLQAFWQVVIFVWLCVNGAWRFFCLIVGRDAR